MTIKQSTGCTLIQGFPVLLILAQKYNRCLETPFEYHPPDPTHSPEYYEALDALYHTVFGHGHDLSSYGSHGYGTGYHGYGTWYQGHGAGQHGHGTGYHGHGTGQHGHETCHGQGADHHGYGTSYHGNKYPQYGHGSKPTYIPSYPQSHGSKPTYIPSYPQNHGHKPTHTPSYHGYPYHGYGSVKRVYNYTNVKGYKTYAPGQAYNIHKYKVVVKNRRGHRGHKRRAEKLQEQRFFSVPLTKPGMKECMKKAARPESEDIVFVLQSRASGSHRDVTCDIEIPYSDRGCVTGRRKCTYACARKLRDLQALDEEIPKNILERVTSRWPYGILYEQYILVSGCGKVKLYY